MNEILISIRKQGDAPAASVHRQGEVVVPASHILPEFKEEDAAALRWLLEDSVRISAEIAKPAAVMAETRLRHFGEQLFEALRASFDAATGDSPLDEVALSVDDPEGLTRNWPWELLARDEYPVALACRSFTRRTGRRPSRLSSSQRTRPMRALIVVARPGGPGDVAFRSVASRVLQAISKESIEVELLRPPTFAALRERLHLARNAGTPYDIVHFDGHGSLRDTSSGPRGVLHFEDESATKSSIVDGRAMGELLAASDVPLLILNACHSGSAPLTAPSVSRSTPAAGIASASFAEQVASAGAIDVVSMSHAVYVATAALIVQDLYRCLDRGRSVGEAVAFARRRWEAAFVERSPAIGHCIIRHFGQPADSPASGDWPDYDEPSRSDDRTPHDSRMQAAFHADAPFVAADDPVLLLERALRSAPIVQLNGLRGSGKTSLLLELGRWLAASKADDPERIVYVDLGDALTPADAVAKVTSAEAGVLLVDRADNIHGDALRKIAPWSDQDVQAFVRCLETKSAAGVQILLAASGSLSVFDQAERVIVPPLDIDDVRKLIELRTARQTAAEISEPALRWTAGVPGVVPILIDRHGSGAFADAATTLATLSELCFGRFSTTQPPLQQLRPLQLPAGAELFQPDVGLAWLLMQFQGQAFLSPFLWQIAKAQGLGSLGADHESPPTLAGALEKLDKSGLVTRLGDEDLLLHPLLPCLIAHPYNEASLATKGYLRSLARVQGLYAQYIQWLAGSPFSSDERPPGNAKGWDCHNLLHAFDCLTGELQVEHMGALSLARRLRSRFLEVGLPDYWSCVLQRLQATFEQYPPAPDDGQFNPGTEMKLLLMQEATRQGDHALAAQLAEEAGEAARSMPGTAGNGAQANTYDVHLKTGRLLADKDVEAAVASFNAALEAAGEDPVRLAMVQLELTRLLRKRGTPSDLFAARDHGESALSLFRSLVQAKIREREEIVLTTMSLSLVYEDLVRTPEPDPEWRSRGEALCRESLALAEDPGQKATAWYNLGRWRQSAKDFAEAAQAFLEAASLYERLDRPILLAYSLAFRAKCLLEREDFLQARLEAVRAATLLAEQPTAAKQMLLYAYNVGEDAWAKFNQPTPP